MSQITDPPNFNAENDAFYKSKVLNASPVYNSDPSKAIFSFDIPEVSNLKAEFVYNYFVKNERTLLVDASSITISTQDDREDIEFYLNQRKDPRYVILDFEYALDVDFSTYNIEGLSLSIQQNVDKLFVEGATGSKYFAGSELIDTFSDRKFYEMLDTTILVPQVQARLGSQMETANHLAESLSNGITDESKKLIRETLSQTQPHGIAYAPTDTRLEDTLTALDPNGPTGRQTFSMKMNKGYFDETVRQSNKIALSVFEDELRAYYPILQEYADNIYQSTDPNQYLADEYNLTVIPVSLEPIDSNAGYPRKSIVGYVLEKFEVGPGGSLVVEPPIIVENAERSFIIDRFVKYGKTYFYKVRTCAALEVVTVNEYGQTVLATVLILSEGKPATIECIEQEPPLPPENFIVEFDYKYFQPVLTWDFPTNPQRDIKRFQIFKRNSAAEPFTVIAEYDFDDSESRTVPLETTPDSDYYRMDYPRTSFRDVNFEINSSPIYAVACVDAHGITSNYSTQMKVKYDKFKNKLEQKMFSFSGAPKSYPNIYLNNDTFIDTMKVSGKDRMTIIFDPEYYTVLENVIDPVANETSEKDLRLIKLNPNSPTYKLQIINTDYQDSEIINIKIKDQSSTDLEIDPANINAQNLSFEFGLDNI